MRSIRMHHRIPFTDDIKVIRINASWLFHFIFYYLIWIVCIGFAAQNRPYIGPMIALCLFASQIAWEQFHQKPYSNALYFAISLMLIGALSDTIWLNTGLIYFNANPFGTHFAPPWMICLWLSFGFNLIVTSEKMLRHYFLWGVASLVSVPFAYWLGVKANAVILPVQSEFYLYLGLFWALCLPLVFYIYNQLKFYKIEPNKNTN